MTPELVKQALMDLHRESFELAAKMCEGFAKKLAEAGQPMAGEGAEGCALLLRNLANSSHVKIE